MAIFNSYVKLPEGIHLHSKGTIFFCALEDQQRQFVEYPLAQEPAQPQESKERTFGRSLEWGIPYTPKNGYLIGEVMITRRSCVCHIFRHTDLHIAENHTVDPTVGTPDIWT